jgi:hypothetical protein
MQSTHVKNSQGVEIARLARKAGISRDSFAKFINDQKRVGEFLNGLKETPAPKKQAVTPTWQIWKTIKLGTHKNADAFRKAIKNSGMKIGDWGNDILGKPAFNVSSVETDIILTRKTVAEIGFTGGATLRDIYAKAVGQITVIDGEEYEVILCPNEVGPQLRLQYTDQPKGEWLRIAMEAITDSGGSRILFYVEHDSGDLWLNGDFGYASYFWSGSYVFVFGLRKKISA